MDNSNVDTAMDDAAAHPDIQDQGMMDSMDDLFGEANDGFQAHVNVNIPLPAASLPPPPGLIQRIAELQTSGACTKLAWSSTGSIARISPDGSKVTFCVFVEDPKTGAWSPGKESPYPIQAPEGTRFVHVQFNTLGHDLAVTDDVGLVHLFIAPTGLGRVHTSMAEFDMTRAGRSNTDAIAGFHWLPIWPAEFKMPFVGPASKTNGTWGIQMKPRDPNAPRVHNPSEGKGAAVFVTRNNCLTLLYQQESGRWYAVHKNLDHAGLSDDMISHASFCEYGNQLLLVLHDEARRFRVLTVTIEWNPSQQARPSGQPSIRVNPSLSVGHLTRLEHVSAQHSDLARLTGLSFLPQVPEGASDQQPPSPPTIVATFTHASLPADSTQQAPEASTAIARWQLEGMTPTMHGSFSNLKKNANATPALPPSRIVQRQPDQGTLKSILSIKAMPFGTPLAFLASDGSVEFRDRNSFNVIEPLLDTAFVTSLPQAGFEHLAGFHNMEAAISNDGSAMALVQPDGKLDGKVMYFRHGWHHAESNDLLDSKALVEAAVMCIARQHTILTYTNSATAETLSLLPPDLSPEMYRLFFKQMSRLMPKTYDTLSLDETKKQMTVLRDVYLPRALSTQLVLGTRPPQKTPTLPAQLAWMVLNLKHATVSLMTTIGRAEHLPTLGADVVHSLRGLVRWSADIFVFILEALLTVNRKTSTGTPSPKAIQNYITSTNSPAFHLLLCSYSRTFLRYLANYLPRYFKLLGQKVHGSRTLLEKQQLFELAKLGETMPFKFDAVHGLVVETEKAVSDAYSQTNTADRPRAEIELTMLTECTLPDQLHTALNSLMTSTLPKLMPDLDIGKLYFWDTAWLHLRARGGSGSGSGKAGRMPLYDALKKTPIKEGAKLRRCRRCDSAMEDVAVTTEANRDLPPWLQAAQRQCVCTCAWYLP